MLSLALRSAWQQERGSGPSCHLALMEKSEPEKERLAQLGHSQEAELGTSSSQLQPLGTHRMPWVYRDSNQALAFCSVQSKTKGGKPQP